MEDTVEMESFISNDSEQVYPLESGVPVTVPTWKNLGVRLGDRIPQILTKIPTTVTKNETTAKDATIAKMEAIATALEKAKIANTATNQAMTAMMQVKLTDPKDVWQSIWAAVKTVNKAQFTVTNATQEVNIAAKATLAAIPSQEEDIIQMWTDVTTQAQLAKMAWEAAIAVLEISVVEWTKAWKQSPPINQPETPPSFQFTFSEAFQFASNEAFHMVAKALQAWQEAYKQILVAGDEKSMVYKQKKKQTQPLRLEL